MTSPASPATSGVGRILFVAANPSIDRFIEVDSIELGAINRPDLVIAVPGGKGLNAARAAAALGGRVTAAAIVAGRAGEWIGERLAALGIDVRLVADGQAGETRTCLSALDRSTGRLTEFYEPGPTIAPETWAAFETAIAGQLGRGDVAAVVCSGSLPPGAPVDGYARIARIARSAKDPLGGPVAVIVDSHGPALEAVLAEHPTLVKVNATEAIQATVGDAHPGDDPGADDRVAEPPGPDQAVRAARALLARGARQAVVTLGRDGAVACAGAAAWRLRSRAGHGAYPVGSGDAFVAGLAVALVDGTSLVDAARHGMAAGIANAFLPGAGRLDPAAAAGFLDEVDVTPL